MIDRLRGIKNIFGQVIKVKKLIVQIYQGSSESEFKKIQVFQNISEFGNLKRNSEF